MQPNFTNSWPHSSFDRSVMPPVQGEPVELEQLKFGSKSECACGLMLESYVSDFKLKTGETFQVPLLGGRTCDFKVNGLWFEYHPIQLQFEFKDKQAYRQLMSTLKRVAKHDRETIASSLVSEKAEQYYRKRSFLIEGTIGHRNFELVVADSPKEFINQVLKRFSAKLPSNKKLSDEFKQIVMSLK